MKRKKKGSGGASWMDTYGDMVTLLLCFFVLLYSMSSINQEKWEQLVRSFNPNAVQTPTETTGGTGPVAESPESGPVATQEQVEQALTQIYKEISDYAASLGTENSISVTQGSGYVFISFDDAVFFDGDSYTLRDEGTQVLDRVSYVLSAAGDSIDEIQVLGHTAQATATAPNNPTSDRFLASNRATVVLVYLQEHSTLDPARMLSVGYGQWRPVSGNATSAERAKNRRVELVVTGLNLQDSLGDNISQYYTKRSPDTAQAGEVPTTSPPSNTP